MSSIYDMKMSKSEKKTSERNWKVIRDSEAGSRLQYAPVLDMYGSRGASWHEVTFTLGDFLAFKELMKHVGFKYYFRTY